MELVTKSKSLLECLDDLKQMGSHLLDTSLSDEEFMKEYIALIVESDQMLSKCFFASDDDLNTLSVLINDILDDQLYIQNKSVLYNFFSSLLTKVINIRNDNIIFNKMSEKKNTL